MLNEQIHGKHLMPYSINIKFYIITNISITVFHENAICSFACVLVTSLLSKLFSTLQGPQMPPIPGIPA